MATLAYHAAITGNARSLLLRQGLELEDFPSCVRACSGSGLGTLPCGSFGKTLGSSRSDLGGAGEQPCARALVGDSARLVTTSHPCVTVGEPHRTKPPTKPPSSRARPASTRLGIPDLHVAIDLHSLRPAGASD